MKNVVIIGAGFGGLELASILSERIGDRIELTLIDKNKSFYFGFSKLDDFPRHATTIFMADYEYIPDAGHIKIILKDDPADVMKVKMQSLDVWNTSHLPSAADGSRRMARDRHNKRVNCLFIDERLR